MKTKSTRYHISFKGIPTSLKLRGASKAIRGKIFSPISSSSTLGFTLIELLVSMIIIMVVGTIILVVFFSALRGTDKSQRIITLRQDGNYALTQMTKLIREAKEIVPACSSTQTTSTVTIRSVRDELLTTYTCTPTTIASESAQWKSILFDGGSDTAVSSCTFTCGYQPNTTIPFVTVTFRLAPQKIENRPGSELDFSGTVLLRNTQSN